jgi:hypothetical protein
MRPDPAPLPGLATVEELAAGRSVVLCALCRHPLTGREARLRGLGDDCAAKLGMRAVRGPGRFVVEQDGLFGE